MPPSPPKGPGPRDGMAPPPPGKGIDLRMGKDMGLRIECGDEPLEACLAAAKPLIDKVPNLTLPPAPPPGGPDANAPTPPAPPAPPAPPKRF